MAEKRVFRSKKKVSGVRGAFKKWAEWEEDDYVIGKFVQQGTDQYDKPNWTLEVYDAEMADKKFAKSILEKHLTMNSSGQLNKAMEKVEEGQVVKVTYKGTSKIEKGKYAGKDAHLHEVEIMEEDDGSEPGEDSSEDDL